MDNKGIVLIVVVIVIALLGIIAVGVTSYITEALQFNIMNINQEKALYMAQAGVMAAIVDYSDDGAWSPAQNVNVTGEFYYHAGQDANFLLVDASNPETSGGGRHLRKIPIQNINSTSSITITDMIVSWTSGGNITKVKLDGTTVWDSTAASPASINITDFSIASGVSHTGNNDQKWEFSQAISGDVIVTFIFSDGSQRKVYLLDDDLGVDNDFSITATGEIRSGATIEARRTLIATYDVGTSEVTSWEESPNHIIP